MHITPGWEGLNALTIVVIFAVFCITLYVMYSTIPIIEPEEFKEEPTDTNR